MITRLTMYVIFHPQELPATRKCITNMMLRQCHFSYVITFKQRRLRSIIPVLFYVLLRTLLVLLMCDNFRGMRLYSMMGSAPDSYTVDTRNEEASDYNESSLCRPSL